MTMDSTVHRGPDGALILYSPDLARLDLAALLPERGVECRPLLDRTVKPEGNKPTLYLISVPFWLSQSETHRRAFLKTMRRSHGAAIVLGEPGQRPPDELEVEGVLAAWLEEPVAESVLRTAIASGLRAAELGLCLEASRQEARDSKQEMEELHRAGMALSSEKDLHALQHLILGTSMALTHADAGTLYVVEENEHGEHFLRFGVAQNDSIKADYEHEVLAIDKHSVAGHVASTGEPLVLDDVYRLPADVEYEFNPAFDRAFGYVTRSMMVTPMINYEGTVVGVIQLINRKHDPAAVLSDAETVDAEVQPFTRRDERMLSYLGGQAAVALENRMLLETNRLYKDLQGAYSRLEEYLGEVSKVITAASEVEAGTFQSETLTGVAEREDALGHLGRVFQRMAAEVSAREERLKQQVTALHIEIDQTKRARQVAEITESNAFLHLQEKARALRQKR
ncbi:MAG TPA: GAF domain-containing protein [Chloroflexota bacterium]